MTAVLIRAFLETWIIREYSVNAEKSSISLTPINSMWYEISQMKGERKTLFILLNLLFSQEEHPGILGFKGFHSYQVLLKLRRTRVKALLPLDSQLQTSDERAPAPPVAVLYAMTSSTVSCLCVWYLVERVR